MDNTVLSYSVNVFQVKGNSAGSRGQKVHSNHEEAAFVKRGRRGNYRNFDEGSGWLGKQQIHFSHW